MWPGSSSLSDTRCLIFYLKCNKFNFLLNTMLGWEDPLEKGMAPHSSILAWRIPWAEDPAGLQSMVPQRIRHDWATNMLFQVSMSYAGPLGGNIFPYLIDLCQHISNHNFYWIISPPSTRLSSSANCLSSFLGPSSVCQWISVLLRYLDLSFISMVTKSAVCLT